MKTNSRIEKLLGQGAFVVTSECGPPRGADPEVVRKKGELLRGVVDGVNVTDNQTSVVRMSSLSACAILKGMGLEPILQMVCRDRNRIALQSDLLGAAALGINNVLCLSGDHQKFGDHPQGKNVYDIDSIQLIQTVCRMRDEGKFLGGEEIKGKPVLFVGAAENPFADPFEIRAARLGEEGKGGLRVYPDAVHLQPGAVQPVDGDGVRAGAARKVRRSGGGDPLQDCRDGQLHEEECSRDGCSG